MKAREKNHILVVCHDAGAGQMISAYVKKHKARYRVYCLVSGPAKKIFARKGLSRRMVPESRGLKLLDEGTVSMVLCGTSWVSLLERHVIHRARAAGVKSAVYLDHWTNYRERFGHPRRSWRMNIPNELWVGDKHAFKLAKQHFKSRTVKLVPNAYFQEVKAEYRAMRHNANARDILFISEPTMLAHKTFYEAGYEYDETDILKRILDYLSKKNVQNTIIICYHPAEKRDKYSALLARYGRKLHFRKQDKNILKDFARAKLVIGRRSMALALAALCGRRVVSYIPDRNVAFPLPFNEITKIRDINKLKI
ncbi:MAG: hypothetical protein AAB932_04310 [Patescibacteria group bacterium]